jgi:hypothetical protein
MFGLVPDLFLTLPVESAIGTPGTTDTTAHNYWQSPRKTAKGHQMGDTEGDPGPIPASQRLPLPAWAFIPSQPLSLTTI